MREGPQLTLVQGSHLELCLHQTGRSACYRVLLLLVKKNKIETQHLIAVSLSRKCANHSADQSRDFFFFFFLNKRAVFRLDNWNFALGMNL